MIQALRTATTSAVAAITIASTFAGHGRISAAPIVEALTKKGVLGGVPVSRLYPDCPELADLLLVAVTETVTGDDINRLTNGLQEELP